MLSTMHVYDTCLLILGIEVMALGRGLEPHSLMSMLVRTSVWPLDCLHCRGDPILMLSGLLDHGIDDVDSWLLILERNGELGGSAIDDLQSNQSHAYYNSILAGQR